MNVYQKWLRNNPKGRKQLFEAAHEVDPKVTQSALTNYLKGDRRPMKNVAEALARVMNVPVDTLAYRFENAPEPWN